MRELLHISDVHFGPPHVPEVAEAVLELIERRRPDRVILSGDLTQRAKPRQFIEARRFVDRMAVQALVVPGNHDVPLYRFWERIFTPYGAYQKHFAPDLEPEFEDDEMLLLGINTAHGWTLKDGRVTRSSLRRVAARLALAPAGIAKIVVAHHQLVPPPRYDTQRVLSGAHEALDVFSRYGVELVLSGHLHQAYVSSSEAYQPSGRRPVLLVHSGTSTSNRGRGCERLKNTCNWITIDTETITISLLEWRRDLSAFVEISRHQYPRIDRNGYALSRY